jgi:nucleoid DNA-binding protein
MKFDYLIEDAVANHGGEKLTKKKAEELIREVFENIKLAMLQGEGISIRGFGSFKPVEKAGRVYIEPRNQRKIEKGPSIYPKFTPSGKLKEALNGEE